MVDATFYYTGARKESSGGEPLSLHFAPLHFFSGTFCIM